MANERPMGVTILAVLAIIAAIAAGYHMLQFLHILPLSLGPMKFFTFDILGALSWGILLVIYIWLFRMLWSVNPQGWLFVTAISVINLVLAFVSVLGGSTWQALLPAIVINAIILIYALLPGTKAAFGTQ